MTLARRIQATAARWRWLRDWLRDWLLWAVSAVALLLGIHSRAQEQRIDALERIISTREAADPLMPKECTVDGAVDPPLGSSREKPCRVDFYRLLSAPQQFNGRWVVVSGRYESGFETSALFGRRETKGELPNGPDYGRALWVSVPVPQDSGPQDVVGRFRSGPSGHMWQFFGELAAE